MNVTNTLDLFHLQRKIDDIIDSHTDAETGEISEDAWAQVEKLAQSKTDIIANMGITFKKMISEAEFWKQEKKRIERYQKRSELISEKLKALIEKWVQPGEKIRISEVDISWRKSEAVEIDDVTADLKELHKQYPDLVEELITYKPNKTKLKELLKTGLGLKGIRLSEKNNIQIK